MQFLIEYNRKEGKLVTYKTYDNSERDRVDQERLELELQRHREGNMTEIVVLQAASEEQIRKTHGRYFVNEPTPAEASHN